jgi:hypothetical protein
MRTVRPLTESSIVRTSAGLLTAMVTGPDRIGFIAEKYFVLELATHE